MSYFFVKLLPRRPDFPSNMTDDKNIYPEASIFTRLDRAAR